MDTQHLKAFLRIAECGSISRAAQSLGIAQPSLSQQLLRLEDEVGTALFERTVRGVTLTEAGHIFLERARHLLHAADQALADARHCRQDARGEVVFAMPPSLARLLGPPLVMALAEQAPHIRVRLVEAFHGTIRGWLEAEKIDLGILHELGPMPTLALRPLLRDPLVAIAAVAQTLPSRIGWDTVAALPLILPGPQHGLRQLVEREAARAGVLLAIAQQIDSTEVTVDLVAAGMGLAIVPLCAARSRIRAGTLAHATIGPGLWRDLALARNVGHILTHASVRVESLTRAILARLAAEGAWQGQPRGD